MVSNDALFGGFIVILLAVLGFFFKRERELTAIGDSAKAAHKRLDRLEALQNGKSKTRESSEE